MKTHFPAGTVDLQGIDTKRDGSIAFTGEQAGRKREPDAIKWLDDDRLVVANEGDYEGGSRGFTIFDTTGKVLYESGAAFEHAIASIGHYPEKRSSAKGVEPEGLEMAQFGEDKLSSFFRNAPRSSASTRIRAANRSSCQLLPSGVSPRALSPFRRNLFATANEVDLVEDGGARGACHDLRARGRGGCLSADPFRAEGRATHRLRALSGLPLPTSPASCMRSMIQSTRRSRPSSRSTLRRSPL